MDDEDAAFLAAAAELEARALAPPAARAAPVPSAVVTSSRPNITPRESFFLPRGGVPATGKRQREDVPTEAGAAARGEEEEAAAAARPRPVARWVWPESLAYPRRDYQYEMVVSCLRANTLVCLPTGLGKTFVAAVVMYNFYAWHPTAKVVFLAPTKPLVAQQVEACYNVMGIPYEHISEMTGTTNPGKRNQEWKDKRCFFVTPQVLHNDLNRGALVPESIRCLVVDEAHRARGSYAYVNVVRTLAARGKQFRVVGLTATPAKTTAEVQDVIDNLLISKLQVRADGDIDVSRYVHSKTVEKVVIKLPPEVLRIRDAIDDELTKRLQLLCKDQAYFATDPAKAPDYGLMQAQNAWRAQVNGAGRVGGQVDQRKIGFVFSNFAHARLLAQARKVLTVHGLVPFLDFCRDKRAEGAKSLKGFLESQQFGQMWGLAQKAVDAGVLHPKVSELISLLQAHFGRDADSRVIVFTTLRDSVESIVSAIKDVQHVKVSRFVGQANNGQKQVEQLDVLTKFRSGQFNTLVATCVGEEGLDVGECDLIVLYDSSGSPIRTMQRMGRTGRKRQGRCVSLVTEGAEENLYDRSKSTGNNILRTLQKNRDSFRFYAPKEEEVEGLVPGRIQKPELREAVPPAVSMKDARRQRKNANKALTTSVRQRGAKASKTEEQMAKFLLDTFGLTPEELESEWPEEAEVEALLAECSLDFTGLLNRGVDIGASLRSVVMRDMVTFLDVEVPDMDEYGGVSVTGMFANARVGAGETAKKKAKPKRIAAAPAKPVYIDDSNEGSSKSEAEIEAGNPWSRFYNAKETVPKDKEEADDDMYEPSDVWFKEAEKLATPEALVVPPPPPPSRAMVSQPLSPPRDNSRPAEKELESGVATALPENFDPLAAAAAPPVSPVKSSAPTTPRPIAADHLFKTPVSKSSASKRARDTPDAFDVCVLSKDIKLALLQMPLNRPKGHFFPPPPPLQQRAGHVASRRIDCAVCSLPFQDSVSLGLHCFQKHWPTDEQQSVASCNPTPGKPPSTSPAPTPSLSSEKAASAAAASAAPQSQFEVEAILKRRQRGGRWEYFVRWRGYSTQHCTWEPDENLVACSQILADFLADEGRKEAEAKRAASAAAAAAAAPASEPGTEKQKRRKRRKAKTTAKAFLDLEANLSGEEGSSDEHGDDDDDEEAAAGSWVVDDDDDIVYSGTPPSQPPDLAFYRRANAPDSPSASQVVPVTPVQPRPRKKKEKEENKKPKRLLKRAAVEQEQREEGDVLVFSSETPQAKKPACSICGQLSLQGGDLCAACLEAASGGDAVAELPPVLSAAKPVAPPPAPPARPVMIVDQKALNGGAIRYMAGLSTVACPNSEDDGNFLLSKSLAALVFTDSAFKASAQMMKHVVGAADRNASVLVIVESASDAHGMARRGPVFDRVVAQLCSLPNVSLLLSSSPQDTAAMITRMLNNVVERERLAVSHDWVTARLSALSFLAKLPGIGIARAISLLTHFGSLKHVALATAQQLQDAIGSIELPKCVALINYLNGKKG